MVADGTDGIAFNVPRTFPAEGVVVRIKVIAPVDADAYPPGVNYSFHYGALDPADPPADTAWPVGHEDGTMLRYDNDHGDATHHRHVGADRDEEYEFEGLVDTVERFWSEIPAERFGPSDGDLREYDQE